jgi:hypothetical protein
VKRTCQLLTAIVLLALLPAAGCGTKNIPNTRVADNSDNREVLDFVEKYRKAVEDRDMGALLQMTSRDYFDDMGTPQGDDDVDYDTLAVGLQRLRQEVLGARYQISYRAVTFTEQQKVLVDLLYTGWFKVATPEGEQWRRRLEPHRIVLAKEDRGFKIISGM